VLYPLYRETQTRLPKVIKKPSIVKAADFDTYTMINSTYGSQQAN
jgi:hypothetical protein